MDLSSGCHVAQALHCSQISVAAAARPPGSAAAGFEPSHEPSVGKQTLADAAMLAE